MADQKLDFSLSNLIFNGPQEELTITYNAQPALLTTCFAFFTVFIGSLELNRIIQLDIA